MVAISSGQCGMCAHFGENDPDQQKLVQIRIAGQAPEDLVEDCGHPANAAQGLRVSAVSGCAGFQAAS